MPELIYAPDPVSVDKALLDHGLRRFEDTTEQLVGRLIEAQDRARFWYRIEKAGQSYMTYLMAHNQIKALLEVRIETADLPELDRLLEVAAEQTALERETGSHYASRVWQQIAEKVAAEADDG